MIDSSSKIRVSFIEPGSVLKSKGSYTSAQVKVTNENTDNESFTVLKDFETVRQPVFTNCEKVMILEWSFISYWLTPKAWKPGFSEGHNAAERMKLSVYQKIKTLDKETLLVAAVKLLLTYLGVNYNEAKIDLL